MNTAVQHGGTHPAAPHPDPSPAALLARIVPEDVVCYELLGDPDGIVLHPDEQALIARSVESRRREFATGRHCAHRALEDLGHPAESILLDAKGSRRISSCGEWGERGAAGSVSRASVAPARRVSQGD
ncbi:hypothetical protein [Streptomyces sp. NRRL WC-3618]|uniref:hypothetical protein n=1 Tax=Streptomyces sp. NRRL WC-3618 TaxID=1519490 RepID=UPI0006ADFB53|nr:hypothetical protein [Streptomyces sp. NRRL WC-3618]